jgi:hypothetical protein
MAQKEIALVVASKPPLHFSVNNAKLTKHTASFSLPAGHTCPGADQCLAKRDLNTGRIVDGPKQTVRCFAASMEVARPNLARALDRNIKALREAKTEDKMADLIQQSLRHERLADYSSIRIHVHGDFFSATYFRAWAKVARQNPQRLFYAYTKSLPIWIANFEAVPLNMLIVASHGGKFDHMIKAYDLRSARWVMHPEEAEELRLPIDKDESLVVNPKIKHFALLLHGTQPAGTEASLAIRRLRRENVSFSYSRMAKKNKKR